MQLANSLTEPRPPGRALRNLSKIASGPRSCVTKWLMRKVASDPRANVNQFIEICLNPLARPRRFLSPGELAPFRALIKAGSEAAIGSGLAHAGEHLDELLLRAGEIS